MQYSGNVYKDYNSFLNSSNEHPIVPTGTCIPFSKKMFVTATGKILPCERIGHQFAIGQVDRDKVDIDFEGISKKYNANYDKMGKNCNACFNIRACSQCIFNLNIDDNMPKCEGLMTSNDFARYLSSHMSFIESKPDVYSRIMEEVVFE